MLTSMKAVGYGVLLKRKLSYWGAKRGMRISHIFPWSIMELLLDRWLIWTDFSPGIVHKLSPWRFASHCFCSKRRWLFKVNFTEWWGIWFNCQLASWLEDRVTGKKGRNYPVKHPLEWTLTNIRIMGSTDTSGIWIVLGTCNIGSSFSARHCFDSFSLGKVFPGFAEKMKAVKAV